MNIVLGPISPTGCHLDGPTGNGPGGGEEDGDGDDDGEGRTHKITKENYLKDCTVFEVIHL